MKKFHFGLQQVMEWRERNAEQERSALERLHQQRELLEQERQSLLQQMTHSQSPCATPQSSSADDLRHLAGFLDALRTRENRVRQTAAECQVEIGKQTTRCLEADRNHELLLRLRERKHASWNYDLNRELEDSASDSYAAARARDMAKVRSGETW